MNFFSQYDSRQGGVPGVPLARRALKFLCIQWPRDAPDVGGSYIPVNAIKANKNAC
jgi:hypothetical protein